MKENISRSSIFRSKMKKEYEEMKNNTSKKVSFSKKPIKSNMANVNKIEDATKNSGKEPGE